MRNSASPIRKPLSPTSAPIDTPKPATPPGWSAPPPVVDEFLEERHTLNNDVVLQRKLGSGAMGEAWLAFSPTNAYPSPLVIKTVRTPGDEDVDKALREVNALRQLQHPHIVKYYNAWIEKGARFNGHLCIAMEYCEYGDLRTLLQHQIKSAKLLTNDQVMAFGAQIISAVAYCHSQRVIHRDIKPENILLTRRSPGQSVVALIADFGLARTMDCSVMYSRVGTPNYLSPEVAKGDAYTMKTDIWAVGVILHELMSLARPFAVPKTNPPMDQDKYLRNIILRITSEDPIPAFRQAIGETFCPSLINMVITCLKKREKDRPAAVELLTTFSKTFSQYVKANNYIVPALVGVDGGALQGAAVAVGRSPIRRAPSPLVNHATSPVSPPTNVFHRAPGTPGGGAVPTDRQSSPLRLAVNQTATNNASPQAQQALPQRKAPPSLLPSSKVQTPPTQQVEMSSAAAVAELTRMMLPFAIPASGQSHDCLMRALHDDGELFLLIKLMVVMRPGDANRQRREEGIFKLLFAMRPEINAMDVIKIISISLNQPRDG